MGRFIFSYGTLWTHVVTSHFCNYPDDIASQVVVPNPDTSERNRDLDEDKLSLPSLSNVVI